MDLMKNKGLITNTTKGVLSKVSYILVWSDTNTMNRTDSESYEVNEKVNTALLKHTLSLIDQILKLNPHEILIMDNEGNFPKHENPLVKVIPSYQSVGYFDNDRPKWLDKINISDYCEDDNFNAAKSTAMAYNHGIIKSSGDYLVTCNFVGNHVALLRDINMHQVLTAPYMYPTKCDSSGCVSETRGKQVLKEVYDITGLSSKV